MSDYDVVEAKARTNNQALIDTAIASAVPYGIEEGDDPAVIHVLPAGATLQLTDTEPFQPTPRRHKGVARLRDIHSLVEWTRAHSTTEGFAVDQATIWADPDGKRLTAVLNGPATQPGWGDWQGELTLRPTPEWQAWTAKDGQWLKQVEFAEFIEDRIAEIASPPGAELLEMATTFQATTSATFRSATVLQSGARRVAWDEQVDVAGGHAGQINVPYAITFLVALYEGTQARRVDARLRYRVADGKLAIGFSIIDRAKVERVVFDEVVVEAGEANLPIYFGTPPTR